MQDSCPCLFLGVQATLGQATVTRGKVYIVDSLAVAKNFT